MSSKNLTRNLYLDLIRTLAIVILFLYHFFRRSDFLGTDWFSEFFAVWGRFGVEIFFPLSGFLIAKFLIKMKGFNDLKVFFKRRFFRIVPIYIVAVFVYIACALLFSFETENLHNIWVNFLFLTGWFIFFWNMEVIPYTITWSMSVEEFAYIIFGFSAFFLKKKLILLLITLCILPIIYRYYLLTNCFNYIYFFPPARIDSVAIGSVIAYYRHSKHINWTIILSTIIVAFLWYISGDKTTAVFFYPIISLITSYAIINFDRFYQKKGNLFKRNILTRIGLYSYGIYLFHLFFIEFFLLIAAKYDTFLLNNLYAVLFLSFITTYFFCKILFEHFELKMIMYSKK